MDIIYYNVTVLTYILARRDLNQGHTEYRFKPPTTSPQKLALKKGGISVPL